ncbi:MAG: radical SAM protein [Candidatus Omnitrophota bacterium]|jgi:radical SAM superfamily enzyme YgiQ (UPF0313 family)
MAKKILLVNPPSAFDVYKNSKVRAAVPRLPVMSLAMLASVLLKEGAEVKILDLAVEPDHLSSLGKAVKDFLPDFVGITATTPLFFEAASVARTIRGIKNDAVLIAGGAHPSALPEECLKTSDFDIIVIGEGEETLKEIVRGDRWAGIRGVAFREDGKIVMTPEREITGNLDDLPVPALQLFDLSRYSCPRMISRRNPVGPLEMSRGCVFRCSYCNKNISGRTFRIKSPERVIEEIAHLRRLGFREFHVLDDQFSTDIKKAKEICRAIIRSGIGMPWNLRTGVRVDRIDEEFLDLARRAGCYQVGVGFESGSQASLDAIGKGIDLTQAFKASGMIRRAGLECVGFFMLGLPTDTADTLEETINFAIRLDPDYAKATILVPFPGTVIFDEFEKKGLIKTRDWRKYNFHNASEIYVHPNLDWMTLNRYYNKFHRRFYLRSNYIFRHFFRSLFRGRLIDDLISAFKTFSIGGQF